eukprot:3602718-Rhodomonas_salina.1
MKGAKHAPCVSDGHPRGPTSSSSAFDSTAKPRGGKRSSRTILPFICSTGKALMRVGSGQPSCCKSKLKHVGMQ